jgi:hypothetical protein
VKEKRYKEEYSRDELTPYAKWDKWRDKKKREIIKITAQREHKNPVVETIKCPICSRSLYPKSDAYHQNNYYCNKCDVEIIEYLE